MNPSPKNFSLISLYIALAGLLVAGASYVVLQQFDFIIQAALVITVIALGLYIFLEYEAIKKALVGRQAHYASNLMLAVFAVVVIVILVNYLVYMNPQRWDMTEDKAFTLSPETITILDSLQKPVKAQAFYTSQQQQGREYIRLILDQYQYNSKGRLEYEIIDPEANPIAAANAGINQNAVIVFWMDTRKEQVTYASEQEITAAIMRLSNPEKFPVYFITGHGEYDPEGSGEESYAETKKILENKSYTVSKLNLLSARDVPEDARAIILAGPRKPISEEEAAAIKMYLDKGGALAVFSEPRSITEFGEQIDPLAKYLQSDWGIVVGSDVVIDMTVNPPTIAAADAYGDHPITQKLQGWGAIFPTAHSLKLAPAIQDMSTAVLITTSARNTWAETDINSIKNGTLKPDQGIDMPGPIQIAVAAENTRTSARLVVVGDSDFAGDSFFGRYGNGRLVVNMVDWLSKQDHSINLTPRTQTQRFIIPPQAMYLGFVLLVVVFILPGAVLLAGIISWVRRKRRG